MSEDAGRPEDAAQDDGRSWWIYTYGPIDSGWPLLGPLHPECERELRAIQRFARAECEWDGDCAFGPRTFVVPVPPDDELGCGLGYVWKQHDNGTTFIASPRPLPWLKDPRTLVLSPRDVSDLERLETRLDLEEGGDDPRTLLDVASRVLDTEGLTPASRINALRAVFDVRV